MAVCLQTERLILREMSLDDLDFVAAMLADPEVMRFYPKCYSRDEAAVWIERQQNRYAKHGHGLWLAVERDSQQPIGQVGLVIQRLEGIEEREVGYLVHRPFWRRGFALEGARACRDFAFDRLDRQRVLALIRPENVPSRGVASKLGMRPLPHSIVHSGFEHLVYAIERPNREDFADGGPDSAGKPAPDPSKIDAAAGTA
ncbi:MAG TPA: GNAT family N-acetyltransferase [Pirellulales bacterium]|nr:GNAT family N-acetyltransferase [Pirellulales bacterium]